MYFEKSLAATSLFEKRTWLSLMKSMQFAGFGEIGLRGKERQALQPIISVAAMAAAAMASSVPPRQ